MAIALASALLKVNGSAGEVLSISDGAVSSTIDLATAATGRTVLQSQSSDKKAFLLNTVEITATDEDDVTITKTMFLASELHKQIFCSTEIANKSVVVDGFTTWGEYFPSGDQLFKVRVWMPNLYTSGGWIRKDLSALQLEDLFENIRFGASIVYVDSSTSKTLYIDLGGFGERSWNVSTGTLAQVAHASSVSPQTTCGTSTRKYAEREINFDLSNRLLDSFGLTIANVDASSTMTVTLFAYVGATIASPTPTAPSYGVLSTLAGYTYAVPRSRISGESTLEIAASNADTTYNGETYVDNGDVGWVGNYASGGTTDTSISIIIGQR